jgi:hypothetical protein
MKKITLAFALLTIGVQAQTFPFPYCAVDETDTTVEEISTVNFGGTTIANTNVVALSIDETATIVTVNQDETYMLEVAGNTYGNFDTDIVAFIDWNQNDVLDDAGEVYSIGTLTNSNGNDAVSVSLEITIPVDAVLGTTRIRITKTYQDPDSPAEIDPCGILFYPFGFGPFGGYGQALDFTLNIQEPLSVAQFELSTLSIYPIPTKDILNIKYNSVLKAVKVYNVMGQEVLVQQTNSEHIPLDVSMLTVGTYLVTLVSEEGHTHHLKMIKQ